MFRFKDSYDLQATNSSTLADDRELIHYFENYK